MILASFSRTLTINWPYINHTVDLISFFLWNWKKNFQCTFSLSKWWVKPSIKISKQQLKWVKSSPALKPGFHLPNEFVLFALIKYFILKAFLVLVIFTFLKWLFRFRLENVFIPVYDVINRKQGTLVACFKINHRFYVFFKYVSSTCKNLPEALQLNILVFNSLLGRFLLVDSQVHWKM